MCLVLKPSTSIDDRYRYVLSIIIYYRHYEINQGFPSVLFHDILVVFETVH